ncbi:hypothetical protein TNIN_344301 [Trichonephila inaurata madagascariensis]|uniref:Uncharacterized protein n=1 Tax=Trichonephila inaurata madagascariensis TaxID=2747483 RepID=A0A8X7BNE9_9ARAC|nr:hypothetical protein TNIN_344301 [Trichonephila inaurata madagascariensis]
MTCMNSSPSSPTGFKIHQGIISPEEREWITGFRFGGIIIWKNVFMRGITLVKNNSNEKLRHKPIEEFRRLEEAISDSKQEKWSTLCGKLDQRKGASRYWNLIKVLNNTNSAKQRSVQSNVISTNVVQMIKQTKKWQTCLESITKTQEKHGDIYLYRPLSSTTLLMKSAYQISSS